MDELRLRGEDGSARALDTERWNAEASAAELGLLRTVRGPVLDIGCGPGRLVVALGRLGVVALGVDSAPGAVTVSRRRGAPVLQRSVFDRLPGEGRWETVLLVDGNIGIGGDPVRLLERCAALAGPAGTALVELDPPGAGCRRRRARLERGSVVGPWFAWAEVGVDGIADVADAAGWSLGSVEQAGARWFARLRRERETARAVA